MADRKRSWTHEQLVTAVAGAVCWYDVLRALNLKLGGGTSKSIKTYCEKNSIDTSHFLGLLKPNPKRRKPATPLEQILVENSAYKSCTTLKRRLVKDGLLEERCYICGLTEWQGRRIVLIIDHINGAHTDNRIENLRMLCPNCDSQQPTWCGRNRKKAA